MDPPDYNELQATATANDSTNQQPTMIAKEEEEEPMITTSELVKPAQLLVLAQQDKHFVTGGTGSILKVKSSQGPVDLSQSSLLAIEEARRYQQVEKGYKERKAQRVAANGGFSDSDDPANTLTFSITAENEGSYADSRGGNGSYAGSRGSKSTSTAAAPLKPSSESSQVGEWEFTAPAKSDGCCVIS
jgi:hypothetical protein